MTCALGARRRTRLTAVTRDPTAANVTAHSGSALVWSRVGSDGRSRLVHRFAATATATCPCGRRRGLFDPDLGINARGPPRDRLHALRRAVRPRLRRLAVRRLRPARAQGAGRVDSRCSEFAPSVWIGVGRVRAQRAGRCNGLYIVRRGKRCRLDTRVPAETDLRGDRVAYLLIPPGDTTRSFMRVRGARGGKLARRGDRLRGGGRELPRLEPGPRRPLRLLAAQQDQIRNEFFAGRALARSGSSVLEFTDRAVPRLGRLDRDHARERLYYTNGQGLYLATDPPAGVRRRDGRLDRVHDRGGIDLADATDRQDSTPPSSTRSGGRRSASTRTRWASPTRCTTTPRRRARPAFATSSRRRCSASSTRRARWGRRSSTPSSGINLMMMVHGAQEFEWFEPVVAGDTITTDGDAQGRVREERHEVLRVRVRVHEPGRAADRQGRPGPTS